MVKLKIHPQLKIYPWLEIHPLKLKPVYSTVAILWKIHRQRWIPMFGPTVFTSQNNKQVWNRVNPLIPFLMTVSNQCIRRWDHRKEVLNILSWRNRLDSCIKLFSENLSMLTSLVVPTLDMPQRRFWHSIVHHLRIIIGCWKVSLSICAVPSIGGCDFVKSLRWSIQTLNLWSGIIFQMTTDSQNQFISIVQSLPDSLMQRTLMTFVAASQLLDLFSPFVEAPSIGDLRLNLWQQGILQEQSFCSVRSRKSMPVSSNGNEAIRVQTIHSNIALHQQLPSDENDHW